MDITDGYQSNGSRQPRPPSPPDSGYEHDWPASSTICAGDDITSDLSESSQGSSASSSSSGGAKKVTGRKVMADGHPPPVKGIHGQDSDVDSGIVSCRKSGTRIGSTSSADTDSSQETRRKAEYSLQESGQDAKCKSPNYRQLSCGTNGYKSSSIGPVKGDHSVLKECNRRPPTPLTVFPESHCVRFDEHLHLSEQNIRRSCRKLFATLYAQRFSYPSHNLGDFSKSPLKPYRPRGEAKHIHSTFNDGRLANSVVSDSSVQCSRLRSHTVPESELRKQRTISRCSAPASTPSRYHRANVVNKENSLNVFGVSSNPNSRKTVSWSLRNPAIMRTSQKASSEQDLSLENKPYSLLRRGDGPLPTNKTPGYTSKSGITAPSRTLSTDSGLGECRTNRCTCPNITRNNTRPSSQTSATVASRLNHQCSCCRCDSTAMTLAKSNSCTMLSSRISFQPGSPVSAQHRLSDSNSSALQKTSSCSNLYQRTPFNQITNVPIYSDNMIQAYAQVASVVPDEAKRDRLISTPRSPSENIYDTIKSSSSCSSPLLLQSRKYESPQSIQRTSVKHDVSSQEDSLTRCNSTTFPQNRQNKSSSSCDRLGDELETKKKQYPEYVSNGLVPLKLSTAGTSSGRIHSSLYLKPALKQSQKAASHSNVAQSPSIPNSPLSMNGDVRLSEVEYAVVDKSKKNRFASLPALNRYSSNPQIIGGDERDLNPPIPPKKHLHKSDFALHRSRSSSPKKSFIERVQGFTRSAKNAVQRAFSSERIYRPELEERLEATGQKLHRSKSFIRGLRVSMNRKKKNKPLMAEVVPQASSNPVWDESPSGPNTVVHVRGQLLQLNLDGSQVIELSKPPSKPYGFFVARGRVKNSRGVFVSRMRDQETQKHLAGLLDIGDEILEIESFNVKNSDIMEVNNLMANKNTLILTVLPYICRKDI